MRYINRHYLAIHPSTVNNDKLFSLRRESRRLLFRYLLGVFAVF